MSAAVLLAGGVCRRQGSQLPVSRSMDACQWVPPLGLCAGLGCFGALVWWDTFGVGHVRLGVCSGFCLPSSLLLPAVPVKGRSLAQFSPCPPPTRAASPVRAGTSCISAATCGPTCTRRCPAAATPVPTWWARSALSKGPHQPGPPAWRARLQTAAPSHGRAARGGLGWAWVAGVSPVAAPAVLVLGLLRVAVGC